MSLQVRNNKTEFAVKFAGKINKETIINAHIEASRLEEAAIYSLPEHASWEDIINAARKAKKIVEDTYGLHKNASNDDKIKVHSKLNRLKVAESFGLPENATWGSISEAHSKKSRLAEAAKYGLSEDANWGEIIKARMKISENSGKLDING